MKPILEIQGISKSYQLQGGVSKPDTIGDTLVSLFSNKNGKSEVFHALQDVSLTVNEGDCMGIIGRNGAGKSTLLKVISRITAPSSGRIVSRGRIASLLEVGTGFHPDLTGKENIFLNGVILGMTKQEIQRKLDEIIDFSGVEKFIETPLKHYSSGMQLRLAFAVAAFLEPEILIIDEVLAVGDAEFQKKCIGKMQDVAHSGRTILFVSHNMAAVQALCNKCTLLENGRVKISGSVPEVIKSYLISGSSDKNFSKSYQGGIAITDIKTVCSVEHIEFTITVISDKDISCSMDIRVKDYLHNPVAFGSIGAFNKANLISFSSGNNEITVGFPIQSLANGTYHFSFDLTLPDIEYYHRVDDAITLEVIGDNAQDLRKLEQSWNLGCWNLNLQLR